MQKRNLVYITVALCSLILLSGFIAGFYVHAVTTPASTLTISSGIYPGAPDYTIFYDSGTYYCKNAWGLVVDSNTNATTVERNADGNLTNGIIKLAPGTYNVGSSCGFYLHKTNSLIGSGAYTTILQMAENGSSTGVIEVQSSDTSSYWRIADLAINMLGFTGNGIYAPYAGHSGTLSMASIENIKIYSVAYGYAGIYLRSPRQVNMDKIQVITSGFGVRWDLADNHATNDGNSNWGFIQIFTAADNAVGIYLASNENHTLNLCHIDYVDIQDYPGHANTTGVWLKGIQATSWSYLSVEYSAYALQMELVAGASWGGQCFYNVFTQFLAYAIQTTAITLPNGASRNTWQSAYIVMDDDTDYVIDDDNAGLNFAKNLFYNMEFTDGEFDLVQGSILYNSRNQTSGKMVGEYRISGANTTSTTAVITHYMDGSPTVYGIAFDVSAIDGFEWSSTSSSVTITVTGTLPASWTAYALIWYNP